MIVKLPPRKGDLPLAEHKMLIELYKSSRILANKCTNMEGKLIGKEEKLAKLQSKRDLTLGQLERFNALIPRTSGAMQQVLLAEQKELQLRMDHTITPQLKQLQPAVEALRKDFELHENALKVDLDMMRDAIDRWKQMDALNAGEYTEQMKRSILSHEKKFGELRTPDDYGLPRTHWDMRGGV